MKEKFYKCPICGNTFAVMHDSGVKPICCGKEMVEITANTSDGASEKHVPVVKIDGNKVKVEVGEVMHPMLAEHHIEWVLVVTNKGRHRIMLDVAKPAVVELTLNDDEKVLRVYEYCNLHGLWLKEVA